MISDEQRATIRRLFYGEHWKIGTIAAQLDLHENTVKAAVNIDQFVVRGQARPSTLDPFVPLMRDILKQYPRLTGTRLHEMLRARGYSGSACRDSKSGTWWALAASSIAANTATTVKKG